MAFNLEYTVLETGVNLQGTLGQVPHELIYNIPPFEIINPESAVDTPFGVNIERKTARQFPMTDNNGNPYDVIVYTGQEMGSKYLADMRPKGSVNGIDYADLGFFPRAAVMVQDSQVYSVYNLGRQMLQWGLVEAADLAHIAAFNIISRLPQLKENGGQPAIRRNRKTGEIEYSDQRHPLIRANEFLQWGIDHLDRIPADVRSAHGLSSGPITGVSLCWERGGSNYRAFMREYDRRKDINAALAKTFSYNAMENIGFGNVRGVLIDHCDPEELKEGRISVLPEPTQISVFVKRSPEQSGDYLFMSNKGDRKGRFILDRINAG
jgi:hypothetical protein